MKRTGNGTKTAARTPRKKSVSRDLLSQVTEHDVRVPNRRGVLAYMRAHPRLAAFLPEIARALRRHLGPTFELSLELYKDRESPDRYLTLYVRRDKIDSSVHEQIETFSARYDDRLARVPGYLLIFADGKRPRGSHAV